MRPDGLPVRSAGYAPDPARPGGDMTLSRATTDPSGATPSRSPSQDAFLEVLDETMRALTDARVPSCSSGRSGRPCTAATAEPTGPAPISWCTAMPIGAGSTA